MCRPYSCYGFMWRTYACIVGFCCAVLGFLFGPVALLAFYAMGEDCMMVRLVGNEPEYRNLLIGINLIMWLFFFTALLILLATALNSWILASIVLCLTTINIFASIILCTRYLIFCAMFDRFCLDHSLGRKENDVFGITSLYIMMMFYVISQCGILFVINQYRKNMMPTTRTRTEDVCEYDD